MADLPHYLGVCKASNVPLYTTRQIAPDSKTPGGEAGRAYKIEAAGRLALLAVADQHLVAGRRDVRTVGLQAAQDNQIALIEHLGAEFLDVGRTGLLFGFGAALLSRSATNQEG